MKLTRIYLLSLFTFLLASCSGGDKNCGISTGATCASSGSNNTVNGSVPGSSSDFAASSSYIGDCSSPAQISEKLFLRSWSDELYLWYDEIDPQNPDDFSVTDYFDTLKTNQLTASGAAKDQFHFWLPTDEYNNSSSGASFGYGISWDFISLTGDRTIKVAYLEPTRASALAQISRGDELFQIDNTDVDTSDQAGIDVLNQALFSAQPGDEYTFYFRRGDNSEYNVSLVSGNYSFSAVNTVKTLDFSSSRKLGYLLFNSFIGPAEKPLIEAFQEFEQEGVDELVIDLRYNGGGLLFLASQLAYMIAGDASVGKTFETSQFNAKHPLINPVTLEEITPLPFYPFGIGFNNDVSTSLSLPTLNLSRVYILSSEETCSASEAVINGLRGIDIDVVLVGDTTCGKPYGFYPQDNCGNTYFSIQFQGVNDKGFGDYSDGFTPNNSTDMTAVDIPGCSIDDTLNADLGDSSEVLLRQAIELMEGGSCSGTAVSGVPMPNLSLLRSANGDYLSSQGNSKSLNLPSRLPGRVLTRP